MKLDLVLCLATAAYAAPIPGIGDAVSYNAPQVELHKRNPAPELAIMAGMSKEEVERRWDAATAKAAWIGSAQGRPPVGKAVVFDSAGKWRLQI
jgi:hypothetical protein